MTAVMVVEDERVVAQDIQETLTQLGYDVVGAANSSDECLRQLREARPDVVLMDVRIDGSLDGVETARRLKAAMDVPVIYLTAYADESTVTRASQTQPHGYLLKPFRASQLRSAVEIAIHRHKMESELRRRERWYQTTLQAIGDGVITVDPERVVSFVNATARELIGLSQEELAGRKISEVFRLINKRTRQPLGDCVGRVLDDRTVARLPPGTLLVRPEDELPIEDSIAPIVDDLGELLGAIVVFRDVREQEALREQVASADRLASLGTLAAGVAHEINNPLTYVLASASMAQKTLERFFTSSDKAPGDSADEGALHEVLRQLAEIEEGSERIRRIVADLSILGRREARTERGDVADALHWALRVTESFVRTRARLEVDIKPMPTVYGDAARLGQVFINLLMNAAQAIPEGNAENQRIVVSTHLGDGDGVVVAVQDTGSGMTTDVIRRIFDPFFTTKGPGSGTGLGLSVCRSIVESMDGELTVESKPGEGSTFRVRVPVATSQIIPTVRPVAMETTPKNARILIIDDDKFVGTALSRILSKKHEVLVDRLASDAMRRLERDSDFDVIICDFLMPDMKGSDVHAALSRRQPLLADRILFLTGAFTSEVSDFLARVPNPRLPKPPSIAQIEQCIQSSLSHRAAAARPKRTASSRVEAPSAPATSSPATGGPQPRASSLDHSRDSSAHHVLIVDDEPDLAEALARQLSRAGFVTTHCTSASQAFTLLDTESFDAVLSDVSMPMQDGIELLRAIRSYDQDLPVVLMTGRPNLETALPAVEYGAFKYLVKPVEDTDLIETMQKAANLYRLATLKRNALETLGTGLGEASDRPGLEASFERSIHSLWPAFQPILEIKTRALFGYEALLRSDEPSLPHPGAVLDAAERLGKLYQVGRRMRERASAALREMDARTTLFLNLHPEDLSDPELLNPNAPHMQFSDRIVLEVTERSALDRIKDARSKVSALREAGFRIAVDDLGAGYAGLSSFIQLEPDLVKLDMSLVRDVDSNIKKQRLVRSLTDVCQDLGLSVVGEGVETGPERDTLIELGCDLVQGYLFGRPSRSPTPAHW